MVFVYFANIIVAGWISISSLFFPHYASRTVFSGAYPGSPLMRLVGCLWLAIAILSVGGVFKPLAFSSTLLLQLIYKFCWLAIVALPAIKNNTPYPKGMTVFFLAWVIILPFVIPWKHLLT